MPVKKPISLTIFGILSIGCGLFILSKFAFQLLSRPLTELEYTLDKVSCLLYVSSLIFPPALVAGFIVSGVGVLQGKPWSRYLLLLTTGFGLWGLVNRLILLGPYTKECFYIIGFVMGAIFIWFFNRKPVRTVFPYRKGLKVLTIVWIIVLSLEIVGAGIIWFMYGGHRIPTLQKAVYQSRDESYYSENYLRSPFPLKYTLAIPTGFTPGLIEKYDIAGTAIYLKSPQKGAIIMSDSTLLQKIFSSEKVLRYSNPYCYYEKLHSERFGLYCIILRNLGTPMDTRCIEKAKIDGLKAFIYRMKIKDRLSIHFYLFRENEAIGDGYIILYGFMRQQMDEIISSLKPQYKPLKSPREFFQEGKTSFQQRDFEEAKFSFVSALCLDWENPQYHYYLGRVFFETENWFSAKKHLENAMSFQPHYPEAQELLNQVKSKAISKK